MAMSRTLLLGVAAATGIATACGHTTEEPLRRFEPLPPVPTRGRAPPRPNEGKSWAAMAVGQPRIEGTGTRRTASENQSPTEELEATLSVRGRRGRRCRVKVNGELKARVPMRALDIPAGSHRVEVRCRRRIIFSRVIELEPGQHERIRLDRRRRRRAGARSRGGPTDF